MAASEAVIEERIPFETYAPTLLRLGDELISDPVVALSEVIKNSYDADATRVELRFEAMIHGEGTIVVSDDGHGMDEPTVRERWFGISHSKKDDERISPRGRVQLGRKGIGRFGVIRLARKLRLKTKQAGDDRLMVARFDWDQYGQPDAKLADVTNPLVIRRSQPGPSGVGHSHKIAEHFTVLEMSGLRDTWSKAKIGKLIERLKVELISPVAELADFELSVHCQAFPEFNGPIRNSLVAGATHFLKFEIDQNGGYQRDLNGKIEIGARQPLLCGPLSGVLYYFGRGLKPGERRHMGMKVYRDGFIVRPYGCEGDDWLELKARKSNFGGRMINPNYILGVIEVSELHNPKLRDMSNREGLMSGEEFDAFRDFVLEQVLYLDKVVIEEGHREAVELKRNEYKDALDLISEVLGTLRSETLKEQVSRAAGRQGAHETLVPVFESVLDASGQQGMRKTREARLGGQSRSTQESGSAIVQGRTDQEGVGGSGPGRESSLRRRHRRKLVATDREVKKSGFETLVGKLGITSGIVLRPVIEPLGEDAQEAFLNKEERALTLNADHPMFRFAERLDQAAESGSSGLRTGPSESNKPLTAAPATTMHILKAAAVAWAEFHASHAAADYGLEFQERYEEFLRRAAEKKEEG